MSDFAEQTLKGAEVITDAPTAEVEQKGEPGPSLVEVLKAQLARREVQYGLLLFAIMIAAFWTGFMKWVDAWFMPDSYYQHGPLIFPAAAYIAYLFYERYKDRVQVRPTYAPLVLLLPILYLNIAASRSEMATVTGALLIASLFVIAWSLAGFRWALIYTPAILFTALGMTAWNSVIDQGTLPLQKYSTDGAFVILEALGFRPFRESPTIINLSHFPLNIEAACSGMKLTLAMIATVSFMVLTGRMKWWANLALVALAIPLSIIINSIRFSLIGIFGNEMSFEAGMWMHDYGSYVTLVLCFYVTYKIAQVLGWKL